MFSSIDHIFSTCNGISPLAFLGAGDEKMIRSQCYAFPAQHNPSDHIPIAAIFKARLERKYPTCGVERQAVAKNEVKCVVQKPEKKGGLQLVLKGKKETVSGG
jgi:hypothetical protein